MALKILLGVFFSLSLSTKALAMGGALPETDAVAEVQEGADAPENIPTGPFVEPLISEKDLRPFDHVDSDRAVADRPLQQALAYFTANKGQIKNQRYVTVVDLSQRSSATRMSVIEISTGAVRSFYAAHGNQSDPDNDGWATSFSNAPGSNKSSIGFYLTGGLYTGKNGRSMYLHGLQSTNSKAYERAIVMHGADYVNPKRVGRSQGCPAIERKYVNDLLPKLTGGSLLYVYYNQ